MTTVPDLTALEGPPTGGVAYRPPATGRVGVIYAGVFIMSGSLFALVFVIMVEGFIDAAGGETESPVFIILRGLFLVGFVGPIVALVGLIARGFVRDRGVGSKLPALAAANGWIHEASAPAPSYPGALFRSTFTTALFHTLTKPEPRFVEIGNVVQQIPAGRTRVFDTWGYIAIKLDRALPHLLLEATASAQGTQGALPVNIDRSQRLSLEGDFDSHFLLYAPKDYEADALYIFTPDLMALLADRLGGWHVEIIDDWVFVYAPHDFVTGADAALYTRIFAVVDLLAAKVLDRTKRYRDDHGDTIPAFTAAGVAPLDAPIAEEGQRMTTSGSWYNNLFLLSLVVIGGMCVLFIVGAFVALGVVVVVYDPALPAPTP